MAMRDFRFYDLFAGIGGFHAAMEVFGGRCVMAAEIDRAARETYEANWKVEGEFLEDVRYLTEDPQRLADLEEAEVLCAGFPCQPFSKSGFQQGLRDKTRGTLFHDIMTIVRAKHPKFVILENVKNLAGPRHIDTWRTIVASLRDAGYAVADDPIIASPHVIPDDAVDDLFPGGRPQVRERVFVLAVHVGEDAEPARRRIDPGDLGLILTPTTSQGRRFWRLEPPSGFEPGEAWDIDSYLLDLPEEIFKQYEVSTEQRRWIAAWQHFVDHVRWPRRQMAGGSEGPPLTGFPVWNEAMRERDEIERAIAEEDPPAWKAAHMRRNAELYELNREFIDRWRLVHRVDRFPASRQKFEWQAQGVTDLSELVLQFRPSGLRVKRATYLPALVAITQTSIIGSQMRELTPVEAARLQGFDAPDKFTVHPDNAQAFKQLGNAVNVGVVAAMARALFDFEATYQGCRGS